MRRAISVAYWSAAPLLALLIYWPALTSWFQKDDFAWLGLHDLVASGDRTLAWALFHPLAEGTIRTLSERAFFLTLTSLFGLHALPFHLVAFLTFIASLMLMTLVVTSLTGSRFAGLLSAILWTLNPALVVSLSWASAYNEVLESLIFLLCLWFLLNDRIIAQWITFILGFGVLELNVLYPLLATVVALTRAGPHSDSGNAAWWDRRFRQSAFLTKIAPLYLVSALYVVLHLAVAPLPKSGPYKFHLDLAAFQTLDHYWKLGLSAHTRTHLILLTLGLVAFLIAKLRKREWIAAFMPAWFLITIAPVLPIRDNMNDYYLTVPLIGLAIWGAWAIASAWQENLAYRTMAIALLAVYASLSLPATLTVVRASHDLSERIRGFILGVSPNAPDRQKILLLKGVSPELFWSALVHHPFRLYGFNEVYLVPEDRPAIGSDPRHTDVSDYFIEPVNERRELDANRVTVLEVSLPAVRNITADYRRSLDTHPSSGLSSDVDLADPLAAAQLGPTWYPIENGFRWMPKRATVLLSGPRNPNQKLYITGFCPAVALKSGPVGLRISVEGQKYNPVSVTQPDAEFTFQFDLPARLVGNPKIEVAVEADRILRVSGDPRQLGMPFTRFEIR
ncbi:MAG TPA: hypothetical protein VKU01_01355 [Bryobacteraceae bacterium]|nr:hypothetical protein [Bryobacteraceae bacterium]